MFLIMRNIYNVRCLIFASQLSDESEKWLAKMPDVCEIYEHMNIKIVNKYVKK